MKQNPFWSLTSFLEIRDPNFKIQILVLKIENTLRESKRFGDGSEGILQKKKHALEPVDCTMSIRMVNFHEASEAS